MFVFRPSDTLNENASNVFAWFTFNYNITIYYWETSIVFECCEENGKRYFWDFNPIRFDLYYQMKLNECRRNKKGLTLRKSHTGFVFMFKCIRLNIEYNGGAVERVIIANCKFQGR